MPPAVQEAFADMQFPLKGVDVSKGFGAQQPGTTPTGLNVRGYEPTSKRAKGGARPGLAKYLAAQLPAGAHLLQNLNIVDPADESALLSSLYDWPGLPAGGVGDPAVSSSPAPPAPPLTIPAFGAFPALAWQWDTSTPGIGPGHTFSVQAPNPAYTPGSGLSPTVTVTVPAPSDWGDTTVGQGIQSRNPGRIIPTGGSGASLTKNRKKKLTPTLHWSNPAPQPVGTVLSGTQLNATATDPNTGAAVAGAFTYTPRAGTATTTSPQSLYVLFVPADLTRYTLNTKAVSITAPGYVQASDYLSSLGYVAAAIDFQNFPADVVAGDLLLLVAATYHRSPGATVTVAAVTDSLGNVYTRAVRLTVAATDGGNAGHMEVALWYCVSGFSGPCTVSGTLSSDPTGNVFDCLSAVLEYGGFTTLDGTQTSTGGGLGGTTGAITTAGPGRLAVGLIQQLEVNQNTTFAPAAGVTVRTEVSFPDGTYVGVAADVKPAGTPGQAVAATMGNAGYAAVGATFA